MRFARDHDERRDVAVVEAGMKSALARFASETGTRISALARSFVQQRKAVALRDGEQVYSAASDIVMSLSVEWLYM